MQLVWTDALLAVGVLLAILDYFDLIGKAEALLDHIRKGVWEILKDMPRDEAITHPYLVIMVLVCLGNAISWTEYWIDVPVLFFYLFIAVALFPLWFYLAIWVVLRVLDWPPRGTVASVGLLLVCADVALRFIG